MSQKEERRVKWRGKEEPSQIPVLHLGFGSLSERKVEGNVVEIQ